MPTNDHGLGVLSGTILNVFDELGLPCDTLTLFSASIPYFDGGNSDYVKRVMEELRASDGIILSCSVSSHVPSALLMAMMEYFSLEEYDDVLRDKNIFLVIVSDKGGEQQVVHMLTSALHALGAYPSQTLALNADDVSFLSKNEDYQTAIEKTTEDYCRTVRQKRKFFVPKIHSNTFVTENVSDDDENETDIYDQAANEKTVEIFNNLTEEEIESLNEITKLFEDKFMNTEEEAVVEEKPKRGRPKKKVDVPLTCRGLTKDLVNQFIPQLSVGIDALIQLTITGADAGAEEFTGYLRISDKKCSYIEGGKNTNPNIPTNPDLLITTDNNSWMDILSNKNTAQKSFLVGKLKVRGNFTLLSKFDSVFGRDTKNK
jgi:multimeric flavodoxin WrbA